MKRYILITFFLFSIASVFSTDYAKIDKQALSVPKSLKTVDQIARSLTHGLSSPVDKSRAIYFWVSHNIKYDLDLLSSKKEYTNTSEILDEVLRDRQGVCQHYAELFHAICEVSGVKSYVITGYTRQNEEIDKISHAWNAVLIDSKFYCIDATWASGHMENGKYRNEFDDRFFLVSPDEFIKTHMPFDPIWQFSDNPLSHKEFDKADFSDLKKSSDFNYADSIKVHMSLDPLEKLYRENRRIRQFGLTNPLIRNLVAFNQQSIISQKFNSAVGLFNKGVVDYNEYILAKNKQFNATTMKDEDILGMLLAARLKVESADDLISRLNPDQPELTRTIREMRNSIAEVKNNLDKEDSFVKKYIKTWKAFRMLLFYSLK